MNRQKQIQDIMIIDDDVQNLRLLGTILKQGGYTSRPVVDGESAIEAILAEPPDLVLLDINMPGMSGLDVCKWIKNDERSRGIPVLFLSGQENTAVKIETFNAGGADFISKPFQSEEVLARTRTHLALKQMQAELQAQNEGLERRIEEQSRLNAESHMALIFALAKLAELRDDDTGRHIERVQITSRMLAEKMLQTGSGRSALSDSAIDTIFQTASLHDIGKVGILDSILLKPDKLTDSEFTEMKNHCSIGADTLKTVLRKFPGNKFLKMGVDVANYHHEKWDGTGYPDGLRGEAIPLAARIVSVADYFDALTNTRCYRPAFGFEETCAMIRENEGKAFDPDVVAAFFSIKYRFGKLVKKPDVGTESKKQ